MPHLETITSTLKSITISIGNQALSSGVNFIILIYLARHMREVEYGMFVVCFAAIFAVAGISASLIATPMAIHLSKKTGRNRGALIEKCINLNFGVHLALAIAAMMTTLFPPARVHSAEIFSVLLASFFYAQRDVVARYSYAQRTELTLFNSNLMSGAVIGFTFWLFDATGYHVTVTAAVLVYCCSQSVSFLYLLKTNHLSAGWISVNTLRECFVSLLPHGKWNVLTSITYSIRTQSHNFIAAPILGLAGVAQINAARNLIMPVMLLTPPMSQILIPRLVSLPDKSPEARRLILISLLLITVLSSLYFLFLFCNFENMLALTGNYQGIHNLVATWALISIVLFIKSILSTTLEAKGFFKEIFILNVVAAGITIISSLTLSFFFNQFGALISLLLVESILCILVISLYLKRIA